MNDRGYVAIDRRVFDHPLLQGRKMSDAAAWLWLITEASWKDRRMWPGAGQMIDLKRGQLAHSLRFMAQRWGWSVSKVRKFLQRWANDGSITLETTRGITVITISNYDHYQTPAPTTKVICESTSFYDSPEWMAVRYEALKASNARCACCGERASKGNPLHVDHIKPRSLFPHLALILNNLQVLCKRCNIGKSNKDDTNWRNGVTEGAEHE